MKQASCFPSVLPNLDLARFCCSLLIICIHTSPLIHLSAAANFFLTDLLARAAVPLFFAVSGFLFFRSLEWKNGKISRCRQNTERLSRRLVHLTALYTVWFVFYLVLRLPDWYRTGWWGLHILKDIAASYFFSGISYHLWYLLASIYGTLILYILLRHISAAHFLYPAVLLWLCECLVYSYAWIGTDKITAVAFLSQRMPTIFDTLFRAVPLMFVGVILTFLPPPKKCSKVWLAAGCFGVLCAGEAVLLFYLIAEHPHFSYLLFTPLPVFFLLRGLIFSKQLPLSPLCSKHLRAVSLHIYLMHPAIIALCNAVHIGQGLILFLITAICSSGIAFLWSIQSCKKR